MAVGTAAGAVTVAASIVVVADPVNVGTLATACTVAGVMTPVAIVGLGTVAVTPTVTGVTCWLMVAPPTQTLDDDGPAIAVAAVTVAGVTVAPATVDTVTVPTAVVIANVAGVTVDPVPADTDTVPTDAEVATVAGVTVALDCADTVTVPTAATAATATAVIRTPADTAGEGMVAAVASGCVPVLVARMPTVRPRCLAWTPRRARPGRYGSPCPAASLQMR